MDSTNAGYLIFVLWRPPGEAQSVVSTVIRRELNTKATGASITSVSHALDPDLKSHDKPRYVWKRLQYFELLFLAALYAKIVRRHGNPFANVSSVEHARLLGAFRSFRSSTAKRRTRLLRHVSGPRYLEGMDTQLQPRSGGIHKVFEGNERKHLLYGLAYGIGIYLYTGSQNPASFVTDRDTTLLDTLINGMQNGENAHPMGMQYVPLPISIAQLQSDYASICYNALLAAPEEVFEYTDVFPQTPVNGNQPNRGGEPAPISELVPQNATLRTFERWQGRIAYITDGSSRRAWEHIIGVLKEGFPGNPIHSVNVVKETDDVWCTLYVATYAVGNSNREVVHCDGYYTEVVPTLSGGRTLLAWAVTGESAEQRNGSAPPKMALVLRQHGLGRTIEFFTDVEQEKTGTDPTLIIRFEGAPIARFTATNRRTFVLPSP